MCIFGICSAGITFNNVVKPENKQNAVGQDVSDDLEPAETAQFGFGGFGVPNGYEAYQGGGYGGYGGGYGGNYGGGYGGNYGGGYGGYGGGYGDYGGFGGGGCCGGFGYGKKK